MRLDGSGFFYLWSDPDPFFRGSDPGHLHPDLQPLRNLLCKTGFGYDHGLIKYGSFECIARVWTV